MTATIVHLSTLLDAVVKADTDGILETKSISKAPWWLRIISDGGYCTYKNVTYVPDFHIELMNSKSIMDRELAMATLLQYHSLWYHGLTKSMLAVIRNKFTKQAWHTFLYTQMYLKSVDNAHYDNVWKGFICTRYHMRFGLFPMIAHPNDVLEHLIAVQEASKPALQAAASQATQAQSEDE